MDALLKALGEHHKPRYWFWIEEETDLCKPCTGSIKAIQIAVCRHFGITLHDLTADIRTPKEVLARQVGIYLCRMMTKHSHSFIVQRFNRGDHSLSIKSCNKIERMISEGHSVAHDIAKIRALVASASKPSQTGQTNGNGK